ncbi:MAG: hypothetical protein KL787_02445 [Taibaiella sp.]|nr:hypothetical protein [Taibaiella sp.]
MKTTREQLLVSATSIGGMDMKEKYFKAYPFDDDRDRYIISNKPRVYDKKHCRSFPRLGGLVTTISTACSSAANAIMMACQADPIR